MSKKDFIALADSLRGLDIPEDVLEALVNFCRGRNPQFKTDRWLNYLLGKCGPNGGKLKRHRETDKFAEFLREIMNGQ